ncbi:serine hydrolase [candidate division KSB1 bacterium]|nr:serine hydrolase [candidate division KSB1 bacterium]
MKRTMIFLIVLLLACTNQEEQLKRDINKIISKSEGTIAIAYKDLVTDRQLFINEHQVMHAASTMKVPVMIEVFKQVHQGKFSLDDSVTVINEFHSIIDSSLYSLKFDEDSDDVTYQRIGKKMRIYDLVYEMITVSSNLSTNILIEMVGPNNVMRTMHEIGANTIKVLRGVQDIKAFDAGLSNTTDAYDLMLIMQSIAEKTMITPAACDSMIEIMAAQKYTNKISGLLPPNIKVANKTGHITAIDHDAAIVFPESNHPYILVVLTRGIYNHKKASQTIAEISRVIYNSYL